MGGLSVHNEYNNNRPKGTPMSNVAASPINSTQFNKGDHVAFSTNNGGAATGVLVEAFDASSWGCEDLQILIDGWGKPSAINFTRVSRVALA